jgi:hypothetical protein
MTILQVSDRSQENRRRWVERAKINVIVMGANRRVGDRLYLGQTVSNVVRRWRGLIILVVA